MKQFAGCRLKQLCLMGLSVFTVNIDGCTAVFCSVALVRQTELKGLAPDCGPCSSVSEVDRYLVILVNIDFPACSE